LPVLEFNGQALEHSLVHLRKDKSRFKWELTKAVDEEYHHLDGKVNGVREYKRTGRAVYEWVKGSNTWPGHLLDGVECCSPPLLSHFTNALTYDFPLTSAVRGLLPP
jgi:hypothetical protein